MAFTTWAALKTQILDDLAAGKWGTKSYSVGTRTVVFRDLVELTNTIRFIDEQIAKESQADGTSHPRTYGKQGGGGRW